MFTGLSQDFLGGRLFMCFFSPTRNDPKRALLGISAPQKKDLAPTPQFPADTLPAPWPPPPLLGDPSPSWDFQWMSHPPPPSASDSPFPSPEPKKNKRISKTWSAPKSTRKRNTPENASNRPFPESAFSGALCSPLKNVHQGTQKQIFATHQVPARDNPCV